MLATFIFSILELNWHQRFGDNKKKKLILCPSCHVACIATKQAISRRGNDENGYEMYENENCTINRRGRLLNVWTLSVGVYSRLSAY